MPSPRSLPDLDAIAAMSDPARRNLAITAAYGRLAHAFADVVPGGANWCAFATWASRQAGQTIRREDLAVAVSRRAKAGLGALPLLRDVPATVGLTIAPIECVVEDVTALLPGIERASAAVARGNLKVFAEIAPRFAQAVRAFTSAATTEPAFLAGFTGGPPPHGQDQLRWAFEHYDEARRTPDASRRAQLMLLANIRVGLHEQTRLQPEIQEALDAAVLDLDETARALHVRLERAVPLVDHIPGRNMTRRWLDRLATALAEHLGRVTRVVVTEHLMTLDLPGGALRLGTDVGGPFPPPLATVTHPGLRATLAGFDATPDSLRASGAVDWAALHQRLHFIADFFRAWQERASLFDAPFTAAQQAAIDQGPVSGRR